MKKRNKIITFSVSTLAVLSVCTVGFATWLVGVQNTSEDVKVTATVDDITNQSVFLSAKISEGIKLAEAAGTGSEAGEYKIIEATQGSNNTADENYLGFEFSELKLTMSEDNFDDKPDAIKISLPVYSAGTVDFNQANTVTTNEFSQDGKREGASWSYVSFTEVTLDLTKENFTITDSSTADGFKEYTIIDEKNDFTFAWGTFFENDTLEDKSPVNFYNSLYTDADFEVGGSHAGEDKFKVLLDASQKATKELEAMKTNLKELTLKVEAIKKATE